MYRLSGTRKYKHSKYTKINEKEEKGRKTVTIVQLVVNGRGGDRCTSNAMDVGAK